jgi:hypothetical protein
MPNGPTYRALYNKIPPSGDPNQLSKETRNMSVLAILKMDLGAQEIDPGDTFEDDDDTSYRVARVESEAIDVLTRFTCEEG